MWKYKGACEIPTAWEVIQLGPFTIDMFSSVYRGYNRAYIKFSWQVNLFCDINVSLTDYSEYWIEMSEDCVFKISREPGHGNDCWD